MVKQPGSYTFAEVTAQTANKADWNRARSRAGSRGATRHARVRAPRAPTRLTEIALSLGFRKARADKQTGIADSGYSSRAAQL